MKLENIGEFEVSQADSLQFAEISGDANPLHVNPVEARRYQFGSTVVHGVCGLFKAIDMLLKYYSCCKAISSVKVQFMVPVRHYERVVVECSDAKCNKLKLKLSVAGRTVQRIDLTFSEVADSTVPPMVKQTVDIAAGRLQPVDLLFEDAITLDATFSLIWSPALVQAMFPNIKQFLPDNQIAILLGLTNIVGMQCPGMDSIFGGFNISFKQNEKACDPMMRFNIVKHDKRFSLITIGVYHNTAEGEIEALFRPKPVQQPKYAELKLMVPESVFSDQRALIIGGSRGIGEVTAKLVAAGGGQVVITYVNGEDEAKRIKRDIQSSGGKCDIFKYNVLSPITEITSCFNNEMVTNIYYFASPSIEKSNLPVWNDTIFQKLYTFYVIGLVNLIELFLTNLQYRRNGITVFIPSTIFLEQPQQGFNEYIAAKAAVEALSNQLTAKYSAWKFFVPRLPRMLTDQTNSIVKDSPLRTAEIMLDTLLKLKKPN